MRVIPADHLVDGQPDAFNAEGLTYRNHAVSWIVFSSFPD
jgi:hypothetical protein